MLPLPQLLAQRRHVGLKPTRGGAQVVKRSRHHAIDHKICLHQHGQRHMILTAILFPPVFRIESEGAQRAAFVCVRACVRSLVQAFTVRRTDDYFPLAEICARAHVQERSHFTFAHRRAVNYSPFRGSIFLPFPLIGKPSTEGGSLLVCVTPYIT